MIDDQELVHRLLDAGVADKKTLRTGIALQKESGDSLYETLILKKLISQRATVRLLGKLFAVPTIKIEQVNPSEKISRLLPASMAKRNRSIPLGLREKNGSRQLLVAMYDPTDVLAVGEISTHTGYDVRPVLIGPRDLKAALEQVYGVSDTSMDEIFGGLGSLDLSDAPDTPDKEWAEFFDKKDDVGAESSDISLEMRDRPSTDVLDIPEDEVDAVLAEGEDPKDAFEILETGRHKAVAMADLKKYQVDNAITGNHTDSGSFAQILSANDAEALFSDVPGASAQEEDSDDAAVGEHIGGSGAYEAAQLEEDSDGETNNASGTAVGFGLGDISGLDGDSEPDEGSSRTEIGHGVRAQMTNRADQPDDQAELAAKIEAEIEAGIEAELEAGIEAEIEAGIEAELEDDDDDDDTDDPTNALDSKQLENTGQTQFGMSPTDGNDDGAGAALQGGADRPGAKGSRRNTDYRALGAAILKEESEAEELPPEETQPREAETDALEKAQTGVRGRPGEAPAKKDPVTREIEEDDLRALTDDETNVRPAGEKKRPPNPFATNEPTAVHAESAQRSDDQFRLPDDVPTRELVEVMIQSMIALGLSDGHSLVKKARKLAAEREDNS